MVKLTVEQYRTVLDSFVNLKNGYECRGWPAWAHAVQVWGTTDDEWYSYNFGGGYFLMLVPEEIKTMIILSWPDCYHER